MDHGEHVGHEPTSCGDFALPRGSLVDSARVTCHKPAPGQGSGAGAARHLGGFGSDHQHALGRQRRRQAVGRSSTGAPGSNP